MEETFDFSKALELLKQGNKVCRSGWNGKGMWIELIKHWEYNLPMHKDVECLLPWIGMKTADNGFVPWLCSQTDMLAEDWQIAL
jgi:hypothetical protein